MVACRVLVLVWPGRLLAWLLLSVLLFVVAGERAKSEGTWEGEMKMTRDGYQGDGGDGWQAVESLGLESELSQELTYFDSLDLNHDKTIDVAEFEDHLTRVAKLDIDENQINDMYGNNLTLGMTVGKVWLELHDGDSSAEAFDGVDLDRNGKITWDEWKAELFHDAPQQPLFQDGERDSSMDESIFSQFDTNKDGYLDMDEIKSVVAEFMVREDVDQDYAGTEMETRPVGNTGFSFVFLMEFDTDQDQKIDLKEWVAGFKKRAMGPPPDSILLK